MADPSKATHSHSPSAGLLSRAAEPRRPGLLPRAAEPRRSDLLPRAAEPRPPAWPSAECDGYIIDALMKTDALPASLISRVGAGEAAIRARAREIGLSREFIKKCRLSGSRPAMRHCVKCDMPFLSSGIHNRLCSRCPPR